MADVLGTEERGPLLHLSNTVRPVSQISAARAVWTIATGSNAIFLAYTPSFTADEIARFFFWQGYCFHTIGGNMGIGFFITGRAGFTLRHATAVLGLVAMSAAAAKAQTPLAPLDPVFVQSLRSLNGDTPTTVQFFNATSSSVRVLWLDYSGTEIFYALLAGGQSYVQGTFATHPWLIRYADTGAPVVGFLATATAGVATIQPFAVVPKPSTVALTFMGIATIAASARRRRIVARRSGDLSPTSAASLA